VFFSADNCCHSLQKICSPGTGIREEKINELTQEKKSITKPFRSNSKVTLEIWNLKVLKIMLLESSAVNFATISGEPAVRVARGRSHFAVPVRLVFSLRVKKYMRA